MKFASRTRISNPDSRSIWNNTLAGISFGNVYSWGAAGSIIGTFLTGFYLIAYA